MVRPNASSRPNSNPASASRRDVYAAVTAKIIAAIESGPGGWTLPWCRSGVAIARPTNVASGRPYRGVNTVSLWAAAEVSHYSSGVWGTFNQWRSLGANVRKGERSSLAVLWKDLTKSTEASDVSADEEGRLRVFARGFAVFNHDQVDGYDTTPAVILPEDQRLAAAEVFLANLEIAARFDAGSAYYHIASDTVFMPPFASFKDAHGFYATHLHECAHATGAKHRLDRDFSGKWGKEALAMEELVAELTSAFLLADLGIAHDPRPDHAAYLASWLQLLKQDDRALFTAASKAQAATDWMQARQPGAKTDPRGDEPEGFPAEPVGLSFPAEADRPTTDIKGGSSRLPHARLRLDAPP